MTSPLSKAFSAALLTCVAAGLSTSALASSEWAQNHPRRAEINARLMHQNQRIHHEVKEGDLSRAEAAHLHRQDRQIRHEERSMARANGGYITKAQQKALNQQENAVSRQIGK